MFAQQTPEVAEVQVNPVLQGTVVLHVPTPAAPLGHTEISIFHACMSIYILYVYIRTRATNKR